MSAEGDVHVLKDTLQCEEILIKSECSLSGKCLMAEANGVDIKAGPIRKQSMTTFEAYTSLHCDVADGSLQMSTLIALQIRVNQKTFFLCPKKPKRKQATIKLTRKRINFDKVFDKKDSEIEGKYRKYWFKLKCAEDGSNVYESLAYSGFFISVEGSDVIMRQCDQDIPIGRNYLIQTFPAYKDKFEVEERTRGSKALNLHRGIPKIRVTRDTNNADKADSVINDDNGSRGTHVSSPSESTRADDIVNSIEESPTIHAEVSAGDVLVANGNSTGVSTPVYAVVSTATSPSMSSPQAVSPSLAKGLLEDRSAGRNGGIPFIDDVAPENSSDRGIGADVVNEPGLKTKFDKERPNSGEAKVELDVVVDSGAVESFGDSGELSTDKSSPQAINEKAEQRGKPLETGKNKTLIDSDLSNSSGRVRIENKRRRSFFAELFSCVSSHRG